MSPPTIAKSGSGTVQAAWANQPSRRRNSIVPTATGQDPIGLVLNDLRIIAEERLREGQRPDRPGIVITPNKKKDPSHRKGARKQESGPHKRGPSQRLADFTQSDQKNENAGKMMIEFRIGDASGPTLPRRACSISMVMGVLLLNTEVALFPRLGRSEEEPLQTERADRKRYEPQPEESQTQKQSR